jgi:hypothetical protein
MIIPSHLSNRVMSKPIYGYNLGSGGAPSDCVPQAELVPSLLANTAYLLSTLNGTNKASILSQLDNIRQQMMVIGGTSERFVTYKRVEKRTISATQDETGKFTIAGQK